MKHTQTLWMIIGTIVVVIGAIIAGVLISSDNSSSEQPVLVPNTPTVPSDSVIPLNLSTGNQGTRTNPLLNPATEPQEDEFSIYEQYKSETGALFQDLIIGDGREAESGDSLAVLYTGRLTDGSIFDQSSVNDEGKIEAFVFQLGAGQVIVGWEQAIGGMNVGGKRRIVVPPAVGYGEVETGSIPPNSVLVFDVELIELEKPQRPADGL